MLKTKKLYLLIVFVLVLGFSSVITVYIMKGRSHTHHFVNGVCEDCGEAQGSVLDDKGSILDSNEIIIMPAKLTFTKSTDTDKQITVQAAIEPIEATNQEVNWSVSFQNPSDDWVQNKRAEDYIILRADGLCATLQCVQPFGEEIILKCSSASKPDISSECVLNYLQRINTNWIYFEADDGHTFETDTTSEIGLLFGKKSVLLTANVVMEYDDYTEPSEFETTLRLIMEDEFLNYLEQRNVKPSRTSYEFKVGDKINFKVADLIQMFGLSPDQMGNYYSENQISNILYGYDGLLKPTFIIEVQTINKKDETDNLTTSFDVSADKWAFDVEVQNITLNENELQF